MHHPDGTELAHLPIHLREPERWVFLASRVAPARLLIFVHGFRGNALETWGDFQRLGEKIKWFRDADMLFVGYESTRESSLATAARLKRYLPRFLPVRPDDLLSCDLPGKFQPARSPYEEVVFVGHSLGGVVLRRAITEMVNAWKDSPMTASRQILDAHLRLFSPATAGFYWTGRGSALLYGLPKAERAILTALRHSPSYRELVISTKVLDKLQERTESYASDFPDLSSLRATTVWANPENVVVCERYNTDNASYVIDNKNHVDVCKPLPNFLGPAQFVQNGRLDD